MAVKYHLVASKFLRAASCLAFVALFALHLPARAVTLQQRWIAGQQLGYDATVSGTLTLLDDDESPQPWAGLPIDFKVRGNGALTLDTLKVDEAGIGTIAVRGGDSQIRAMGFGQTMEFTIKNGVAKALMNGKPAGESVLKNRSLLDPSFALRLTPQGQLESVVTLRQTTTPAPKTTSDLPFDLMGALQDWMLRAVPTLWPQGDIKEGAQWTAPISMPLPPKQKGAEPPAPLPVGQAVFTLRGLEETNGRKAHRVTLEGTFEVDAAKAKIINEAAREAEKQIAQNAPSKVLPAKEKKTLTGKQTRQLADARQKISGNLWLDTTTGQLVRAELTAKGRLHTQGTITNKSGRTRPTETWADWDGSVQLQLRRVSMANAPITK